jgi:hypothetical protein
MIANNLRLEGVKDVALHLIPPSFKKKIKVFFNIFCVKKTLP